MLARIHKAMEEKEEGFTLIELLVVIIIIGILAAIAIPVFLNQRKKGVDAQMKSDLRNAATVMETYFTNSGVYPAAATDLTGTAYGLKESSHDVITVVSVRTGNASYCLKASNTTDSNDGDLYYDSNNGGLLPQGTTCT
jgi:type IV pilus assembly protein PilA